MSSKKNIKFNLALVGLVLGMFYFISAKISGKRTNHKIDNITETATELKTLEEKTSSDIVGIKDHLQSESLKEEQNFQTLQGNQEQVLEQLDGFSDDKEQQLQEKQKEQDRIHLERWTDQEGKRIIDPDIKSFLDKAKKDRTLDLNKKPNSIQINYSQFRNTEDESRTIKIKSDEKEPDFHLKRWINQKQN